ncbi:SusC/RagA family TonB-linked outer membrane protein [Flavobacterium sp. Sd200]|uniref:SusC/RagA family TonB-linked outer membrane protein n=1 Tax=Flavobacterium sp. Sd200 TaxID=2692211 RepID=UPI00136EB09A|nr:TonB-dependent receptor [Flavobacterium sp. Sd200]MXN92604.1 SusC/RagA family TonB-linked outer membrane protein [Flavobacterium sp. Sd200]
MKQVITCFSLRAVMLFLYLLPAILFAQGKIIQGTISDANGLTVPGANVIIKGTTKGVQTDMDGKFSIEAETGQTLVISFIGMQTKEVTVTNEATYNVTLPDAANELDEVILVGYGTQKKSDLTGAVSRANLEPFKNAPNVSVMQSLQGTVPGLNIGQVNSAGSTPSITIRGTNTLSGATNPLIILDGAMYTGSITAINPTDIESIDVLKDASSTAVYGAQAANGVILITTKKGGKNKAPTITYTTSYTTQDPTVNMRPMNREQYIDKIRYLYYQEAFLAPEYTTPNPAFNPASRLDAAVLDQNGNILPNNFDWWDAATRTGEITEHNVNINGGGDKVTYVVAAGHTDQKGYIMNDNYKRTSIRSNIDIDLREGWKVGMQSFATFSDYSGAEPTLNGIVRHSPLLNPFTETGELDPFPTRTVLANPFTTYYVDDYDKQTYLFANFYSDLKIPYIKGLSYRINFGNTYRAERHYFASEYGAGQTGNAYKSYNNRYDYTFDNILTYQHTFAKKHDLTLTAVYGVTERSYENSSASANGFTDLSLSYNNLSGGTNQFASSGGWQEALSYQMGRLNYKYDDKYILTGTIRRDGFSGYAKNEKWGIFPSVSGAWVISKESFLSNVSFLEFLKLRAGYGSVGNLVDRYKSISTLAGPDPMYIFGDGSSTQFGQQLSTLGNANLRWESTKGINLGVDFRLFKGRLSGNVEYYNTETQDLIYPRTIPTANGASEIFVNLGNINNRGIEFSLTSQNIETKDFSWSTTLNFSRNVNKIVRLTGTDANGDGREDDIIADSRFMGESIGTIYGYLRGPMYQIGDDIPAGYYPGTYSVVDVNGDGQITVDDRVKQGRSEPAYRAGLLNTFRYKNFTLNVFFNTVQGGKDGYRQSNTPNIGSVTDQNAILLNYFQGVDYWSPSNPDGRYPRSTTNPAIRPLELQDRSFIRLQDISLSYTLPSDILKGSFVSSASLFVSAKNIHTWTKWDGWDPETGQGLTDSGRPVMKGYSVGLNVSF